MGQSAYETPRAIPIRVEMCASDFEDSLYGSAELVDRTCVFNDAPLTLTVNGQPRDCPAGTVFVTDVRSQSGGGAGHMLAFGIRLYPHRPFVADCYRSGELSLLTDCRFRTKGFEASVDCPFVT